jgi:hypothetical protein
MTKQVIISKDMIPEGWSIEAADFTNRLLIRKAANRLGLLGANEVKEHDWFKGFRWKDLYDRVLEAPFVPKGTDNFDSKYCNANEKLSEQTKLRYEIHLRDERVKQNFKGFEFVPGDSSKFEFVNPHLKLTNTGEENVLIEKVKFEELKKSYDDINRVQQNMPTSSLIKQYQKTKTILAYNKKRNNSNIIAGVPNNDIGLRASGLGVSSYSKIQLNNTSVYNNNNNELNCSAYLENN